jgi:putative addiction module component (TIGR02574 family)
VTERARKVLEQAESLSVDERAEIAAELFATVPADIASELHPEWVAELEQRATRAWGAPGGGEPWDEIERRLLARIPD